MHAPLLQPRPHAAIEPDGAVEGYASLFGEIDSARDMVLPGAFRDTLALRGLRKIPMLFQHDPAEPIGIWLELVEDARGLYVRGRLIPDVARAREVLALVRAGALDGLSIGFRTASARVDPKTRVRKVAAVDLWEISIVTFPLLAGARVAVPRPTSAKGGMRFSGPPYAKAAPAPRPTPARTQAEQQWRFLVSRTRDGAAGATIRDPGKNRERNAVAQYCASQVSPGPRIGAALARSLSEERAANRGAAPPPPHRDALQRVRDVLLKYRPDSRAWPPATPTAASGPRAAGAGHEPPAMPERCGTIRACSRMPRRTTRGSRALDMRRSGEAVIRWI